MGTIQNLTKTKYLAVIWDQSPDAAQPGDSRQKPRCLHPLHRRPVGDVCQGHISSYSIFDCLGGGFICFEFWSYYLLLGVYSRPRQTTGLLPRLYFAGCLVWPQCAVCGGWSQSGTLFASRLKPGVSFSVRHISCPSNNRWGDILILMNRMLLHEESEKSNYCVSLSRQPCLSPHWRTTQTRDQ